MADATERDEFRVEVDLADAEHGFSLSERLRSHNLDDEARQRLGDRVVVTRDGARVFLYAGGESEAREAERVMREVVAQAGVSADFGVTRWHPVEEAWRDASVPLPRTGEERAVERERKLAAETREAVAEGETDWEVRVRLDSHSETAALADRLAAEGLPVVSRWRYLVIGALTEEGAHEMAEGVVADSPGAKAWVEPRLDAMTHPLFVFIESR